MKSRFLSPRRPHQDPSNIELQVCSVRSPEEESLESTVQIDVMVHKRRATPSLESGGGDHTTAVVVEAGERTLGGAAFTRFGFPAREASSRGGRAGRSSSGDGGISGSNGRGSLFRRKGVIDSPSECPSSAGKGKRRRAPAAAGSMYASRSFWFRVLCVAGVCGSFLTAAVCGRRCGVRTSKWWEFWGRGGQDYSVLCALDHSHVEPATRVHTNHLFPCL